MLHGADELRSYYQDHPNPAALTLLDALAEQLAAHPTINECAIQRDSEHSRQQYDEIFFLSHPSLPDTQPVQARLRAWKVAWHCYINYPYPEQHAPWPGAVLETHTRDATEAAQMILIALYRMKEAANASR